MGRSRNKYKNKQKNVIIKEANVKIEDVKLTEEKLKVENDTNVMVLSEKKNEKKKRACKPPKPAKKLTKKERRQLQQVVDRKTKKMKRADLLQALAKVQIPASELAQMSSVAHIGTKNNNMVKNLSKRPIPEELKIEVEKLNSIKVRKRMKKEVQKEEEEEGDSTQEDDTSSDDENEIDSSSSDDKIPDKTTNDADNMQCSKSNNIKESVEESKKCDAVEPATPATEAVKDEISTCYVAVKRTDEIQEARLQLPIIAVEQEIVENINYNPVVVLCGETGSGKTTQVPQFLYEAGYAEKGMIGITEPRRVAAISMSQRVGNEMNLGSDIVSYQIRYEGNTTPSTRIKFMTDGVLLREVQRDFMLSSYSVVIIDEAHERSVYTDVLIGLLSRIVPLRHRKGNPLKLVIMSATLRVTDFIDNHRLFKTPPPLIKVEARQYPVTIHFNRRTPVDEENGRAYISEAYKKICKIHRTLPPGGILVFVTGQQEVHSLCRMLKSTFPMCETEETFPASTKTKGESKSNGCVEKDQKKVQERDRSKVDLAAYASAPDPGVMDTDDSDSNNDDDAPMCLSDDEGIHSDEDDAFSDLHVTPEIDQSLPLCVLPLYSLLAPSKQKKIFNEPPENTRLCIVSTNVAETSLTIPGVTYVVDTGKVKKRIYDKVTGVSSFKVSWISRASADQRAGRAGRTGPGHSYRLYSSAVFQDFDEFSVPEISSRPVPDLVLQMKQLNIDRIVNFPFPTSPSQDALVAAEKLLVMLGAVQQADSSKRNENSGKITPLGQTMAAFPVHPRFAKMLSQASAEEYIHLLPYCITIVAALTVRDIFDEPNQAPENEEQKSLQREQNVRLQHFKRLWGGASNHHLRDMGDIMVLLGAVGSSDYSGLTPGFCQRNCLRFKAMSEIRRLRSQLINTINLLKPDSNLYLDSKLHPPTNQQVELLRQIILSTLGDHVAMAIPDSEAKRSNDPKEIKKLLGGYYCMLMEEPVFIHPSSVMSNSSKPPRFVVFQEVIESLSGRPHMKGVVVIEEEWLHVICPQHCNFSPPVIDPVPTYDACKGVVKCSVNATYGKLSWPLGCVEIDHPNELNKYRWFANFFLNGDVAPAITRWSKCLLSRPETMVKSWAKLQPRTDVLLRALVEREVCDKNSILKAWKEDRTYLLSAMQEWIPTSAHNDLICNWPPTS